MMHPKNTYQKGVLTFILYPTDEGTYVSACFELCIIREGQDAEMLKYKILADSQRYLLNVIKNKLGEHLLNQSLPKEIAQEFDDYRAKKKNDDFQRWQESISKIKKYEDVDCLK